MRGRGRREKSVVLRKVGISYNIGRRLAEYDIVTVSGMAFGCDSQAHRGRAGSRRSDDRRHGCGAISVIPHLMRRFGKILAQRSDSFRIPLGPTAALYISASETGLSAEFQRLG